MIQNYRRDLAMRMKIAHATQAHAHVVVEGPDYPGSRGLPETVGSAHDTAEDIRETLRPEYTVTVELCRLRHNGPGKLY